MPEVSTAPSTTQPWCSFRQLSAVSAVAATWSAMASMNVEANTGITQASGVFTPTKAGHYAMVANFGVLALGAGASFSLRLNHSVYGVVYQNTMFNTTGGASDIGTIVQGIHRFNGTTDTLTLEYFCSAGTPTFMTGAGKPRWFYMVYLGPL